MTERVCPVWIGWLLASPVRKLVQNPEKILRPYIKEGMTVLEPGSAMGFFSLPAAKMVGPAGKLVCIDLQEKMLAGLRKRATKAGLVDRIECRTCNENSLLIDDLAGSIDFAFAIAVVHEIPDQGRFFREIHQVLKPGCLMLFAEPKGHVKPADFAQSLLAAENHGFALIEQGMAFGGLHALLRSSP